MFFCLNWLAIQQLGKRGIDLISNTLLTCDSTVFLLSLSLFSRDLGTLIDNVKSGGSRFIGRSQSEDSVCKSPNHSRKESASNSPNSEAVTESPSDSNPSLDKPDNDHKSHHHSHHTNNSSDNSKSNNSNNKSHHHHLHLNFGALAALKRKRKKFSASRNESPVLEPPPEHDSPTSSIRKSVKKVIY